MMAPLFVLLISFAVLRLTGFTGVGWLDNWSLPLRIALFLMFMLTASAHWGRGRPDLIRMAPTAFPATGVIITVTGLLEIFGGVGLLIPQTARAAAICLASLLVAMFSANIRAAIQAIFVGALLVVAVLKS
jgi:uncharacterized membrane protein